MLIGICIGLLAHLPPNEHVISSPFVHIPFTETTNKTVTDNTENQKHDIIFSFNLAELMKRKVNDSNKCSIIIFD